MSRLSQKTISPGTFWITLGDDKEETMLEGRKRPGRNRSLDFSQIRIVGTRRIEVDYLMGDGENTCESTLTTRDVLGSDTEIGKAARELVNQLEILVRKFEKL